MEQRFGYPRKRGPMATVHKGKTTPSPKMLIQLGLASIVFMAAINAPRARAETVPAYNADGVAVTALSVTPNSGATSNTYTVSYNIRTNHPVRFVDLTAAVRDSRNIDGPGLDFAHLTTPLTVNGSYSSSAARKFDRLDTYNIHIAYTLDGKNWRHLTAPSTRVTVAPPIAYNKDGIAVTALSVSPTKGQSGDEFTTTYTLKTNRSVRFADLSAAVRDSKNIDDSHLDFPHLNATETINGEKKFTVSRKFNEGSDTYKIHIAYTLDGHTWEHIANPATSLTIAPPETVYNEDGIAVSALNVTPGSGPAGGEYGVSYTLKTDRPVTFTDVTAAVRDSANIDGPGLDFAHLSNPLTLSGTKTFDSRRSFARADTYKVHIAYTLDGKVWKHIAEPKTAITVTASSTPSPAPTPSPTTRSGLKFRSGINAHHEHTWKNWENWRGRPVDIVTVFVTRSAGWAGITDWTWHFDNLASFPGLLEIAVPFFPDNSGNLGDCAAGKYDGYWKKFATNMVSRNRGNSYIRPAWEFNGDWFQGNRASNADQWIGCFRKVVTAIRSVAPQAKMGWIMNGHGSNSAYPPGGNAWSVYPGDTYVDVIGVDNYDHYPPARNEAEWKKTCEGINPDGSVNQTFRLHGLCYIAQQARAKGKKFAVPEWGVSNKSPNGGGDNPFFIRKMREFFEANADIMAYEAYFNTDEAGNVNSALFRPEVNAPSPMNPNSAAEYKRLFGR